MARRRCYVAQEKAARSAAWNSADHAGIAGVYADEFENNSPTCIGEVDINTLASEIYNNFVYFNAKNNREQMLAMYKERFYLLDKKIKIHRADGGVDFAIARGIDERGGLIAETQDGNLETIRSGEVSIREA